jgi:hypothetical protein
MLFWVIKTIGIKCLKYIFKTNTQKEGIKSYNWFQIFVQQKHAPFYESTCSLDELDEKPNHTKTKISKSWNFEGRWKSF